MKSMLQEASSAQKAIEKAWNEAGKPQEFTIRILEKGSKNFLGMTTQPAVVSITYKPEIVFRKVKEPVWFKKKKEKEKIKKTPGLLEYLFGRAKQEKVEKEPKRHIEKVKSGVGQKREQQAFWRKEFVGQITFWLQEMMQVMGIRANVGIRPDQRILNAYLDKRILKDPEEEKLFFISLSHLLMQFLKRKYKKRFTNYYLIIHTRVPRSDEYKKHGTANK